MEEKKKIDLKTRIDVLANDRTTLRMLEQYAIEHKYAIELRDEGDLNYNPAFIFPLVTIGDLARQRKETLLKLRNIGVGTVNKLGKLLEEYGLHYGMLPKTLEMYAGEIVECQKEKEIDWEKRRWDMVAHIMMREHVRVKMKDQFEVALRRAEVTIALYKELLRNEERE